MEDAPCREESHTEAARHKAPGTVRHYNRADGGTGGTALPEIHAPAGVGVPG